MDRFVSRKKEEMLEILQGLALRVQDEKGKSLQSQGKILNQLSIPSISHKLGYYTCCAKPFEGLPYHGVQR